MAALRDRHAAVRIALICLFGSLGLVPAAQAQDSMSILLGKTNVSQPQGGIALIQPDDGKTTDVVIDGSPARSTEPPSGQTGGYLYFTVADSFVKEGSVTDLWVTVEYLDRGRDKFELEFDAKDPEPPADAPDENGDGKPDWPDADLDGEPDIPDPNDAIYRPAEFPPGGTESFPTFKTDTGKWLSKTYHLVDVWFGNRQNGGADIRINDHTNAPGAVDEAPEVIRKVAVSKTAPIATDVPFADPAPVINGVLDDPIWQTARKFDLKERWQIIHPADKSTWDGVEDYSAVASLAWDTAALYLAFDVTDDVPRENVNEAPNMQWAGDGVEIYIGVDQTNKSRREFLQGKDFQIVIGAGETPNWGILRGTTLGAWNPGDYGFDAADSVAVKGTDRGYIMEIRIPWTMLPDANDETGKVAPPRTGSEIGFNWLANDSDRGDGTSAQEMAMSFSGIPNAWRDPTAWTTVTLSPPKTAGSMKGDLNGDQKVNVQDATLSLRIAVGLLAPTDDQKIAGDANGDGKWNLQDTTLILQVAIGARTF